jgi:tetratricopeptide (TPR) repeat protein
LRRFEDAEHHFEEALEANERMGARPWLAHTQHDYAQMLVARGSAGDRQRAQQRLKQALTVYRELGMQPSTARASR